MSEKAGNRRTLAEDGGFRMLIRVHQVYMPDFTSILTCWRGRRELATGAKTGMPDLIPAGSLLPPGVWLNNLVPDS